MNDDAPSVPLDRTVVRAHLGCLSSGPDNGMDGEWILILEDAVGETKAIAVLDLVALTPSPPTDAAIACLHRAGYELGRPAYAKPWAATWAIARNTRQA